jgi:hypothetical protein
MAERPTGVWRERVASDVAGIAVGTLDADDAVAALLWPEDMVRDTDELFDGFEADVAGLVNHRYQAVQDDEIFAVIERTVKALNAVNARYGGAAYETGSASCSARTSRTFSTTPGSRWMRSPNDIG